MCGGIIWRLAYESLGEGCVLGGPSHKVQEHGNSLVFPDGQKLWDDSLDEEGKDLVSGVYKLFTGMMAC
jgi:predicted secreted protein